MLEAVFLLANVAVIAGFLVFVSYSKHLHIFLAPINIGVSRRPRALGGLDKTPDMDMENVTEDTVFGAGKMEDFTWKQMLDFATCTECGRCQSVCPAWTTGKPLSPKLLIMGLRDNMFASADRLLSGESQRRRRDAGAHDDRPRRPVVVHHVRQLRRAVPGRHRARGRDHRHAPLRGADGVALPDRGGPAAAQHGEPGRPVGTRVSKRTEWLGALDFEVPIIDGPIPDDIEYLYWVGCAGSLDERGRKQVESTARMLHRAGRHLRHPRSARVLHRRPGAAHGQRVPLPGDGQGEHRDLNEVGAKKIVASCPHCFNTMKNEYPAWAATSR